MMDRRACAATKREASVARMLMPLLTLFVLSPLWAYSVDRQTVTFPGQDDLTITADLYIAHPKQSPLILLFHRAGWSRGEYLEIAPRLNALGYNCMAVDLRSGAAVNEVDNKTFREATLKGKPTTYVDAYPDMVSALDYAHIHLATGPVLVWGSSYSASLVFALASEHSSKVDGVLSFAPGEYFARLGKSKTFTEAAARNVTQPVFVTSGRREAYMWSSIFEAVSSKDKTSYVPPSGGQHGSRALWKQYPESSGYWNAVSIFLTNHFPGE